MTPVRSQNNCVILKVSEPAMRSVASRRVRKSRGEQATVKHNTAKMKTACRGRILARNCNQTWALTRQERTIRNLSSKLGRPPARNRSLARRAFSLGGHAVIHYKITISLEQHVSAL